MDAHAPGDEQTKLWNGPPGAPGSRRRSCSTGCSSRSKTCSSKRCRPDPRCHVLDVGCGTGSTTLAVARRLGASGRCIGIDISEPMIAAARARAEREGTPATFICANAQIHAFEPASFDMIISRFGVMFFDDPVRRLREPAARRQATAARLRCIVWRSAAENPFMTTAERAAAPLLPNLPAAPAGRAGAVRLRGTAQRVQHHPAKRAAGTGSTSSRSMSTCTLPEKELVRYLTRLGPVGLVASGGGRTDSRAGRRNRPRRLRSRTCTAPTSALPRRAG